MNAPLDMGAAQLQAWVLSTYQRLERMDVPVFESNGGARVRKLGRKVEEAQLHLLPTSLPTEAARGLDPVATLSLVLRYLAAPMRYEPFAEAAVHKAVPSARCMYPLTYYVATPQGTFSYVPAFHALAAVDIPVSLPEGAGIAIVCVARVWRIAEKYGEFANFPCVLEAGHGLSQLGHLAAMTGTVAELLDRELGRPLCQGDFELPLFSLGLRMDMPDLALPLQPARVESMLEGTELGDLFPRLPSMHALFDRGASAGGREAAARAPLSLDVMRKRQAGNDRSGIAAVLTGRDPLAARLPEVFRAMRAGRTGIASESTLRCQLALIGGAETAAGLYNDDGSCATGMMPRAEFLRRLHQMLPYRGMRYNLGSLVAVLVIQADPVEAIARHGDAAIRDMHLAAGATAQDFSLAAASLGLFARPVRMMREANLESVLPLQGQVIYLVLCGLGRRSNLTMGLL